MTSSSTGTGTAGAGFGRSVPPPAETRAGRSYARFIPREELQGFAAWTPDAFGSPSGSGFVPLSGQPDAAGDWAPDALRADPQRPPATPASTVFDLADDAPPGADVARPTAPVEPAPPLPQEPCTATLLAARQSGYQDGYRDGLVALESFKESFATQLSAQIGQLLLSFDSELGALEQRIAAGVARVATALARQVVRSELAQRPDLVAEVAQQAVGALMASARHVTVLVHPQDLALVTAGCADSLDARGARLLAQAGIERGGCLVECDIGQIDARMATRWAQAALALGTDLPWAASDPPDGQTAASAPPGGHDRPAPR